MTGLLLSCQSLLALGTPRLQELSLISCKSYFLLASANSTLETSHFPWVLSYLEPVITMCFPHLVLVRGVFLGNHNAQCHLTPHGDPWQTIRMIFLTSYLENRSVFTGVGCRYMVRCYCRGQGWGATARDRGDSNKMALSEVCPNMVDTR